MSLLEAAAAAVGAKDTASVRVAKVSDPPYKGRNYEVTNRHTGQIVYLDLAAHDHEAEPAPEKSVASATDGLDEMTVTELKGVARRLDLTVGGTKVQLLSRIKAKLETEDDS